MELGIKLLGGSQNGNSQRKTVSWGTWEAIFVYSYSCNRPVLFLSQDFREDFFQEEDEVSESESVSFHYPELIIISRFLSFSSKLF